MLIFEIFLMATLNAIIDTVIVLVILSRRTERMMGVTKVQNEDGETIYAPLDPDGKPLKVPVTRMVGEKMVVKEEYVGLAWALPALATAHMKAVLMGKAGNLKQQAERFAKGELPLEQAAQAMALDAFQRGKYGQALASMILPGIVDALQKSKRIPGQTGQTEGFNPGV